jgi:hypothetical protein
VCEMLGIDHIATRAAMYRAWYSPDDELGGQGSFASPVPGAGGSERLFPRGCCC